MYYLLLSAGILVVLSAVALERVAHGKKERAREILAAKRESQRETAAHQRELEMIHVIVAAKEAQAAALRQKYFFECRENSPPRDHGAAPEFASSERNLQRAIDELPGRLRVELAKEEARLRAETDMLRKADWLNKRVRPYVDTAVQTIHARIHEASEAGFIEVKDITVGHRVEHPIQTYLDSKAGDSFIVLNVAFEPDPSWEVRVVCGTFRPADNENLKILTGPAVQIYSTMSTGSASIVTFYFDPTTGEVDVTLSERLYPGAQAMIEKYKRAELVSNIVVEMLSAARLQVVREKRGMYDL